MVGRRGVSVGLSIQGVFLRLPTSRIASGLGDSPRSLPLAVSDGVTTATENRQVGHGGGPTFYDRGKLTHGSTCGFPRCTAMSFVEARGVNVRRSSVVSIGSY
jgi:hypothetical protein